ncbi:MAG: SLC13/DASS family transporter [Gammaproteobacteria bacterium]|nr:MAG: SLC13/DASS family transporter [Gammaproteobacteria bacterium]
MKKTGLIFAFTLAGLVLLFADFGGNPAITHMAAIAIFMSALWISEAIPLAATALIPLVAFPLLGISSGKTVAATYINSTIFLFIGGFLIALAMEQWNLHKRIALNLLTLFGGHPTRVVMGFIVATAFLSMWVSNTATTIAMLPVALAIISRFEKLMPAEQTERFSTGLLLSVAYSASIGGMMTLVGTPPNLVFSRIYEISTGGEKAISFVQWMGLGVPVGLTMLLILILYMTFFYFRKMKFEVSLDAVIEKERRDLGRMSQEEKVVAFIFATTALLWITRKGLAVIGLPGWSALLPNGDFIDDGTVAITMALTLFFIPARSQKKAGSRLLDATVFTRIPWSVIILFGGGFALASGFVDTGLSKWLASNLQGLAEAGMVTIVLSIATMMTFLTELTSNTATTQLILPLLYSTAEAMSLSPLLLMLPATLSASFAFMLPVATPPNAIIFGSGRLRVIDMVKTGFLLNLFGIVVVLLMTLLLAPIVFDIR